MKIFLLDTDTFILLLRGTVIRQARTAREKSVSESAKKIRDRCRLATAAGSRVGLSAVSLAELEYGLHASGRVETKRRALQQVMMPFERFDFDAVDCVRWYGVVRAALEQAGKTIGPLDLMIAAHALAIDATLVTHNTREFKRVLGLEIEDWA